MEIIQSIGEVTFKNKYDYEGFALVTNERVIHVGIESGRSCCEDYGYLITNDAANDFVGAELLSIEVVDKELNVDQWRGLIYDDQQPSDVMFVNFETNRGKFQITAYNDHNGYYGHSAVVITDNDSFEHEEIL